MKRIKYVEKYVRKKFQSLRAVARRTSQEKRRTTDFGPGSQPHTIMLRERIWRIELSRSKVNRFWRQHKISIVAITAIIFTGVFTRYVLIGFASTVDFYPSSCLGNWENVQNALGKPDLDPGSSASAFTSLNSAVFATSTAQMFCGNFSGTTDINTLTGKSFQEADLVLSWSVIFPQDEAALAPASSPIGADDGASSSITSTNAIAPDIASSSPVDSASSTDDVSLDASTSTPASDPVSTPPPPAPAPPPTSTSSETVAPPPPASTPDSTSQTATPPPDTTSNASDPNATAPAPVAAPASPSPALAPVTETAPAVQTPSDVSTPTSWLQRLIGVAYADETSSLTTVTDASTTMSANSSTEVAATTTQEGIPTQPQPALIKMNTSPFQNISLPSSTTNDTLAIVYSTDGVTWQPLVNINASNWQQLRYPIPIHSWQELQHLQVAFVGLGASSSPQIFLDSAGVEVSYVDTPEGTTIIEQAATEVVSSTPQLATSTTPQTQAASTTALAPVATLQQVFDPSAQQLCVVLPFSAKTAIPGSAAFSLKLTPPVASGTAAADPFLFDASIGSLPVGVTGNIIPGKGGADTMGIAVSDSAIPGSYTVVVVYKERQPSGAILPNFCQFNLIIDN